MPVTTDQDALFKLLNTFKGENDLKGLIWSHLEYEQEDKSLSPRDWPSEFRAKLAEDPRLLASGGDGGGFHIIFTRLNTERLSTADERSIITKLLEHHPYALFIFSNRSQDRWHLVNVKYEAKENLATRRVLRRIALGPEEHVRTAYEQLGELHLTRLAQSGAFPSMLSPLQIQKAHDDAFDVEAVTKRFFDEYTKVFSFVEENLVGFAPGSQEKKRLFTQRLFNRLMFIAFVQKKGWLKLDGAPDTDYLSSLWRIYNRNKSGSSFYQERVTPLFFAGFNTPDDEKDPQVMSVIGGVPYLNGGLFEENEDDRNAGLQVPDSCFSAILTRLFDRFNFTVSESTPLDIEVAVDPEMLGKVFENLVTGRHESGSYYTPKPIVSFMSREALKGYLKTKMADEAGDSIDAFVDEHDSSRLRNPEGVLQALEVVKVCDPACGSGAYLLGMLHELLDLRASLFASRQVDGKSVYARKLEIVTNNLYGVDLDDFAVNVARLRLWLSLAVDYDGEKPEPLPNLDFKIEQGDSLTSPAPSMSAPDNFRDSLINDFLKAKSVYTTAHGDEKTALFQEAVALRRQIQQWSSTTTVSDSFDWQVEFAEVFQDGGFDIVVANPPYVRQELIKDIKPVLQKIYPGVYAGTADLYVFFYGRALQLLRPNGMLAFISPNKWFKANYGLKLREHVANTCQVLSITDFGELPVFESAATFPMIFVARKGKHGGNTSTTFTQIKSLQPPYPDVLALLNETGQILPSEALNGSDWTLASADNADRFRRMHVSGVPLSEYIRGQIYYGIKTGFNTAFVIDEATRSYLISKDRNSVEIIKPLAIGDDIRKWQIRSMNRWLIVTPIGIDITRYPAVFSYLKKWQVELEKRWDKGKHWWELRNCDYYDAFTKPKIVFPIIAKEPRFAFDVLGLFTNDKTFMMPVHDLYLLGILNSAQVWQFLKGTCSVLGDAEKAGRIELRAIYVNKIPIPLAVASDQTAISDLVQRCLDARGVGCEEYEREINARVSKLYGLEEQI